MYMYLCISHFCTEHPVLCVRAWMLPVYWQKIRCTLDKKHFHTLDAPTLSSSRKCYFSVTIKFTAWTTMNWVFTLWVLDIRSTRCRGDRTGKSLGYDTSFGVRSGIRLLEVSVCLSLHPWSSVNPLEVLFWLWVRVPIVFWFLIVFDFWVSSDFWSIGILVYRQLRMRALF